MNLNRLYKTLVLSGAALTLGACGTPKPTPTGSPTPKKPKETKAPEKAKAPKQLACSEICEGTGRGALCPEAGAPEIPLASGQKSHLNCCWLMSTQHRCCPGGGLPLRKD